MTHDAALEILRLQFVVLTGLSDANVSHGPLDSPRRGAPWITLIPLSDLGVGRPARTDDAGAGGDATVEHAREADVLITAYGTAAVTGLRAAASTMMSDTAEGMVPLASGVSLRSVSPVGAPVAVIRTAHEPRASTTVRIGYLAQHTGTTPASGDPVVVDLYPDDGPNKAAAITITVGA